MLAGVGSGTADAGPCAQGARRHPESNPRRPPSARPASHQEPLLSIKHWPQMSSQDRLLIGGAAVQSDLRSGLIASPPKPPKSLKIVW